ncbi:MAG: biotin--[acetyl-CoA-carboxylase] ligase [Phyllobacteriaceae bacterium]|nr:biotin--[acetyl-CoA-carboxylase] ligase [Phyllobacteriaceae bacterium]
MALARAGDAGRLWVTAASQTAGRGRSARVWVSEPGNLFASALLIDPAPVERLGSLPLVAALAVYDALKPEFAANPHALAIKWPNDVLVDGAKINGVLLESERLPDGRMAVVVGCGVNVAHHPDDTLYPATSLRACGLETSVETVFERLVAALDRRLAQWDAGRGFALVREDWLRAARGIGEPVRVRLSDQTITGRFAELDAEGYLWLDLANGDRRRISAGDLFFTSDPGQPR